MSTVTATSTPTNVAAVRAIGKGARTIAESAPLVVAYAPEGFDWTARGAVPSVIHAWAVGAVVGTEFEVPAQKTGSKGEQTATDYGRGVDALAKAVKALVKPVPADTDADAGEGDDAGSDETPAAPDYVALAVQAAALAAEHGHNVEDVVAAIKAALLA